MSSQQYFSPLHGVEISVLAEIRHVITTLDIVFFVPSSGRGFDRNEFRNQEIGLNLPVKVSLVDVGSNEPKVFSHYRVSFNYTFYKHRFERNFFRLILR